MAALTSPLSSSDRASIQNSAPILYSLLQQVNPICANEWTLILVKGGIFDKLFPISGPVAEKTFAFFGIPISPSHLHYFSRLQHSFFLPPVTDGNHVEYPDDSETPYKVLHPLASGTFGKVEKVCLHANPNVVFARKVLLHVSPDDEYRMQKEIFLLHEFKHPHSIPFYGSYRHRQQMYLLFELCDGNMRQFFGNPPKWFCDLSNPEKASKLVNWMIDLSTGIADFHALQGVHRDLKPENILIKGDRLLIADFGLSTYGASLSNNLASVNGTEAYMAPEQGHGCNSSRAVDVFAMGCIFLELLTFGENISLKFFQEFRKYYGSGKCDFSSNLCYRHNLQAVGLFMVKYLRNRSVVMEPLLDLIEFDMLAYKPVLRRPARDVRLKLLKLSRSWSFFSKDGCCAGHNGRIVEKGSSTKSLEPMSDCCPTVNSEKMEVELGDVKGALATGLFSSLRV